MESNCSFTDFPEDVQLCILSFLSLPEVTVFACTSKHSLSLYDGKSKLWHAMCDRRWGSKTQIGKWGAGRISYKLLYRRLNEWENLIGFWRRSGQTRPSSTLVGSSLPPPLVLFEWGPSFVTGSRVSPSQNGTYDVIKLPFLWMSLSSQGETLNFIDPDGKRGELAIGDLEEEMMRDVIPVEVSFVGVSHMVVEEKWLCSSSSNVRKKSSTILNVDEEGEEVNDDSGRSLADDQMPEMYQYFANKTSPGGNGGGLSRRQRKREKEKQGKMKWGAEHFVKIVNCCPTPSRPLQGLWKGIGEDMKLEFYLVSYDETGGGIGCRRVGESSAQGCPFVFWTSKANAVVNSPFSAAELLLYESRVHLQPLGAGTDQVFYCQEEVPLIEIENEIYIVSHIHCINSSEGGLLTAADHIRSPNNSRRHVEGRVWQYENGSFGFGFFRDNYIIDLKHILCPNGYLLDAVKSSLS